MSTRKRTHRELTAVPPTPEPAPVKETAAERRAAIQESLRKVKADVERARQEELAAAERAAEEQEMALVEEERQQQEAEKKRKEEDDRRLAEEKKKETKRKADEKVKKQPQEKKGQDGKGKARMVEEEEDAEEADAEEEEENGVPAGNGRRNLILSDDELLAPTVKRSSSKAKKNASKTPAIISDTGKNVSNEIVEGSPYPSCMACVKAQKSCQWKTSVIHLRLSGVPNKAKNCESCVRKKEVCQFIWERDESSKRVAEESLDPESSKRVKIDCPDLVDCLKSIDKNIGSLIKLAVAQAVNTRKEQAATAETFEALKTSLEALHEKYNGL